MDNKDYEQCKEHVLEFLNSKWESKNLSEKIDKLIQYPFDNLNADNVSKFDADNTDLAKWIYYIIWHDSTDNAYALKNLKCLDNIGPDCTYRGETINSFKNIFGENFKYIAKFGLYKKDIYDELLKKISTIGNFMLLPGETENRQSLNNLKNSCCKDFPDLFFYRLYPQGKLINIDDNTDIFKFVSEKNKGILPQEFKVFSIKNILESFTYLENDEYFPKIIYSEECKPYDTLNLGAIKNVENYKDYYKNFLQLYVPRAIEMINDRAKRIGAILKERLKVM